MEQEHKILLKRKRKRRRKHIFHITVLLIIIATLYLFDIDKNNEPNFESNVVTSLDDLIPKHNYNWNNLITKNNQKQYIDEYGNNALKGIDISKHQGDIDWSQVKDDDVDFAMIRAGYGMQATTKYQVLKTTLKCGNIQTKVKQMAFREISI